MQQSLKEYSFKESELCSQKQLLITFDIHTTIWIDTCTLGVDCCYIQHHSQTIHPTENFISMNLLQMSCVITWALSFLTSEVVEAVRGQKHHISAHTLALQLNVWFIPQWQFCLPKIHQKWDQIWLSASISRILEPSPQGMISSEYLWQSKEGKS